VKSIPRINAGAVAIRERQLEGVVPNELDMRDANIVRDGIGVEGADSCPLVNATGAATLTPKPFCVIAARRRIAPSYLKHSLRSFQLNVSWGVAHGRLAQAGLVDATAIRTNRRRADKPYRPS